MSNEILDIPEKKVYPGKMAGKNYKIQLAEEKIQWAQYIMFGFAFFAFIKLCLIAYSYDFSYIWFDLIIQSGIVLIYLVGAFFTLKHPSLSIGLVILFYLALQILFSFLHGPDYWHSGISFKIVMLGFLIFGFFYSIKVKSMRRELEEEYQNYLINQSK